MQYADSVKLLSAHLEEVDPTVYEIIQKVRPNVWGSAQGLMSRPIR